MELGKLFKSSLVYVFGNILTKAVGFLLLPFYTRYLAASEYGTIELLELVINVTCILFGLGIIGGAMARVYHEFQDAAEKKSVISTSIALTFAASSLLALFGVLFSPALSRMIFATGGYSRMISVSFAVLLVSSLVEICLVYLRIMNKAKLFVLISCAQFVAMAVLNIFFIGYLRLGIWGFILSKFIVFFIICLFLLYTVLRETGIVVRAVVVKRVVGFGAPLILSAIAFFVIHFSDRFILQHYHDLNEVGIYSVAYKFGFLITYLVGEPFGRVWNVTLYAHTSDENWKRNFSDVFAYFVLALLLMWTVLAFFSSEIMTLMASPAFHTAAQMIPLLALAYVFREIGDFFRQLMYINHQTSLVSRIAGGCAVFNLLLNFVLIKPFGGPGAMWATLLTWALYAFLFYLYSQKSFALSYRPVICGYLLIAVSLYGLSSGITFSSRLAATAFHAALLAGFCYAVSRGNYLTREEKGKFSLHLDRSVRKLLLQQ